MTKIICNGWYFSGTTVIYQILKELGYVNIDKIHTLPKLDYYKLFYNYRDPRDIICSFFKKYFTKDLKINDYNLLKSQFYMTFELYNYYLKIKSFNDLFLIKYEDYFPNNLEILLDLICKELEIEITAEKKKEILDYISLENNYNRSLKFNSFFEYDQETLIHGNHITNMGVSGVWKEIFTDELKEIYNRDYSYVLLDLGYELC